MITIVTPNTFLYETDVCVPPKGGKMSVYTKKSVSKALAKTVTIKNDFFIVQVI